MKKDIVKKAFFKIFAVLYFLAFLLISSSVLAAVCPVGSICIENPLEAESIEELIEAIINFIFWVAVAIAPLMIIIAGFYFVASAGDPGKIRTARDIILYTFIGLLIIFLAKGVIGVIRLVLGGG